MSEFCLIVEGNFFTTEEAKHALVDPFVEEYVEQNGKFKIHNFDAIFAATGITLSDLSIGMLEEGVFEISCKDLPQILNRRRAEQLAENLRRQAMFDEISIEPLD